MDPGTSGEDSGVAAVAARADAAAATYVSDDSGQSMPKNPRAAQHTHTAWQNEYFVLTDSNNFPDVRMRAKDRGKGPADLGRSCGSKTLVPSHYEDDRADPDKVILAQGLGDLQLTEKQCTVPGARLQTARLAD